ncbi:MAG TPA: PTS sorbitol transporter subunit IIC, partial [Chloroflexi bacterium]|nr:PTS sorbitol transporter subunit IIC [Chloroflexota bacterium]
MDALVRFVEGFFALIQTGADTFVGIATGIIPTLLVLMTLVNLIVRLIGPERVERT